MAETSTPVTEPATAAENNGGDPKGGTDSTVNAVSTSAEGQTEKTFTQKELDEIVKQRLERERKGMPSKKEMDAFKAWQDSQKTAEQLSAEKISAAESAKSEAEKRAEAAEAKCTAYSKGVKPEAVEDVIALAMSKVSDSVTVEAAIDAVIAKYPSFCSSQPEKPKGITTGVNFGNGSGASELSGVEAAFLRKNPDIKI